MHISAQNVVGSVQLHHHGIAIIYKARDVYAGGNLIETAIGIIFQRRIVIARHARQTVLAIIGIGVRAIKGEIGPRVPGESGAGVNVLVSSAFSDALRLCSVHPAANRRFACRTLIALLKTALRRYFNRANRFASAEQITQSVSD